jgi:hypothetical protein
MAKRGGTHYVISASLTDTGAPTYLARDGKWVRELQHAWPVETDAERDALIEQALRQERVVADPYFFDVRVQGNEIDPMTARERIRAQGPTTRIRRPD